MSDVERLSRAAATYLGAIRKPLSLNVLCSVPVRVCVCASACLFNPSPLISRQSQKGRRTFCVPACGFKARDAAVTSRANDA